ncbi:MAG: addiction module protein [Pyrinomonadaceae bacterium]
MNAELVLPLDSMTVAEKMDVIERIMSDLSRNSCDVPAIEWHGQMLGQRAENQKTGTDRFITLDEAAARIRERTGR